MPAGLFHPSSSASTWAGRTSSTVDEFCAEENISASTYYKLKRLGLAPAELMILPKVIRITPQARRDWHAMVRARAQSADIQLEVARKRELARVAGKRAAKSAAHVSRKHRRSG